MFGDDKRGDFEITLNKFKKWVAKAEPFKAAVDCVFASISTAALFNVLIDTMCTARSIPRPSPQSPFFSICGGYKPLAESLIARGPLRTARDVLIMNASSQAIFLGLKNIRGKEDVETSMVAGFGSGVMISLVTGMRGPEVISVGVIVALLHGVVFKASGGGTS